MILGYLPLLIYAYKYKFNLTIFEMSKIYIKNNRLTKTEIYDLIYRELKHAPRIESRGFQQNMVTETSVVHRKH